MPEPDPINYVHKITFEPVGGATIDFCLMIAASIRQKTGCGRLYFIHNGRKYRAQFSAEEIQPGDTDA